MKNQDTQTKNKPAGRPKYEPIFPTAKEWTFSDFMEANDINTESGTEGYGKGPLCSMLTLRKFMTRDMFTGSGDTKRANPRSLIVTVKGVTAEPNSENGIGRRGLVYALRVNAPVVKAGTKAHEVVVPIISIAAAPSPAVRTSKSGGKKKGKGKGKLSQALVAQIPENESDLNESSRADLSNLSEATRTYEDIKAILAAPAVVLPAEKMETLIPVVTIKPEPEAVIPIVHSAPEHEPITPEAVPSAPEGSPVVQDSPKASEEAPAALAAA